MLFSDLYKSPRSPLTKLRNSLPHAAQPLPPDYDADLVSRDKAKQKEAVKRYLAEKVRNDWEFSWPPQPSEPPAALDHGGQNSTAHSVNGPTAASSNADDACAGAAASPTAAASVAQPNNEEHSPAISPARSEEDGEEAVRDSGELADSESDTESVYSTVSEDPAHFRSRAEWTSDLSGDELPRAGASPFRFDSPDAVGTAVQASIVAAKARRRRELREEAAWNDGLACFMARRDSWTGARTVRVRPKPPPSPPPSSPRRLFWRSHTRTESSSSSTVPTPLALSTVKSAPSPTTLASPLSPMTTHHSHHSQPAAAPDAETITPPPSEPDSSKEESRALYPVETVLPVPPPLIPAQNPMRASVTPSIYPSLYDKVVVSGLQPSCPINLGDMLRACVVGWKRDGEWPRPTEPVVIPATPATTAAAAAAAAVVVVRRRKEKQAATSAAAAAAVPGGHGRKGSSATVSGARRMSFGGFLERVSGDREKDRERDGKENREDEEVGTAAGKGIRRSLQKVLGLGIGHGGNAGTNNHHTAHSPPAADERNDQRHGKEVTAAG